jgi:hypothetical protein
MPVVAAVERGCQLSGRGDIRIAVQVVTDLVRIFLVNARQCKISKPLRSVDIKTRGHGGRSGIPNVRRKKEEDSAECGVHPVATLNEISAGLEPLRGRGSGKK